MKYSIPFIRHIHRVVVLSQVIHQVLFLRLKKTVENLIPKSCGVSSPGGESILCYQAVQDGHQHRNLIPHHESERT